MNYEGYCSVSVVNYTSSKAVKCVFVIVAISVTSVWLQVSGAKSLSPVTLPIYTPTPPPAVSPADQPRPLYSLLSSSTTVS